MRTTSFAKVAALCGLLALSGCASKISQPDKYSGFAFGTGIDRLAMFKYGITDMRYLYSNDIRFLSQFDRKD